MMFVIKQIKKKILLKAKMTRHSLFCITMAIYLFLIYKSKLLGIYFDFKIIHRLLYPCPVQFHFIEWVGAGQGK